jgi:hypothetical protein
MKNEGSSSTQPTQSVLGGFQSQFYSPSLQQNPQQGCGYYLSPMAGSMDENQRRLNSEERRKQLVSILDEALRITEDSLEDETVDCLSIQLSQ